MSNTLIGFAVKGVASGICLASESAHHLKEKKGVIKEPSDEEVNNIDSTSLIPTQSQDDEILSENDDELWALDEVQEETVILESAETENSKQRDISNIMEAFVLKHPLTTEQLARITRLTLHVILPQKRPKDRSRGFIRAYAPVLESSAIDQQTFIDFLATFERATQASSWIQAVNLAGIAGFFVPTLTGIAIKLLFKSQSKQLKTYKSEQGRISQSRFYSISNLCTEAMHSSTRPTMSSSVPEASTVSL